LRPTSVNFCLLKGHQKALKGTKLLWRRYLQSNSLNQTTKKHETTTGSSSLIHPCPHGTHCTTNPGLGRPDWGGVDIIHFWQGRREARTSTPSTPSTGSRQSGATAASPCSGRCGIAARGNQESHPRGPGRSPGIWRKTVLPHGSARKRLRPFKLSDTLLNRPHTKQQFVGSLFDSSMNSKATVKKWQAAIIADAEAKLGRSLRDHESNFIVSRDGFIALEMIHDTVKAVEKHELETYLSSECQQK
jgi:hypothetical protein